MCRIERTLDLAGAISHEVAHAVTSLSPERADPDTPLALRRDHRLIETRLQGRRDVILRDDDSTIRSGTSPPATAALRNTRLAVVDDLDEPLTEIREVFAETRSKAIAAARQGFLEWPRLPSPSALFRNLPRFKADTIRLRAGRASPMGQRRCPRLRSAPDDRRDRVLVAEDGDFNRDLVQLLLERAGFQVDLVDDGAKALAAVQSALTPFHFLLMDLDMPVMDGYLATRAIRDLGAGLGAMPILALTSLTKPAQISQALASGMDGWIGKPLDPATFADRLRSCLVQAEETCRRREMAGLAASPLVWNRHTFDELSRHLDHTRLIVMVNLFEQHLNRALTVLQADDPTPLAVAIEAHNLVSAAGSLGFDQLCAASGHAQTILRSSPEVRRERLGALVADVVAAVLHARSAIRQAVARGTLFDGCEGLGLSA